MWGFPERSVSSIPGSLFLALHYHSVFAVSALPQRSIDMLFAFFEVAEGQVVTGSTMGFWDV